MPSKTIYTHRTADGEVHTRTSARPYTHVVVGVHNTERMLARAEAKHDLAKEVGEAAKDFAEYQRVVEAGIGGMTYYGRHQGGAYLNKSVKHKEVSEWEYNFAKGYVDMGEVDYLKDRINDYTKQHADYMAQLKAKSPKPTVLLWSSRADLAAKAISAFEYAYDCTVEEINGQS